MSGGDRILQPGRNCWKIARASRVSFLVDGAAYFEAVANAIERARHSILVVGWDIHSRTVLRPGEEDAVELSAFLHRALERRPELRIHLLEWDFSVLFALERDWTPVFRRGEWLQHRRLEFHFDDQHPLGASQHQKLVVVDDELAFTGGLDLTVGRWDTNDHAPEDARRRLPDGKPYPPFHDVQVAVAGEAARALGELARSRWERATGQSLHATAADGVDPWPPDLAPDLTEIPVAIARTQPSAPSGETIREAEQLYLDAIAAAKRLIYIETQYFTSSRIAAALEERLAEADGPEVVLVLPRDCHGWLEESTMGALRGRVLERLKRADVHDRLRALYPVVASEGGGDRQAVNVHAKVLVVDDQLLRVGSSNLSNRSMGFDSECDIAIESKDASEELARAIRAFRHRLVAEHLGWTEEQMEARIEKDPSLVALLESAQESPRRLVPIAIEPSNWDALVPDRALVDPDGPEAPGRVAEEFIDEDLVETTGNPWIRVLLLLGALLVLAAAWRWTSLSDWIRPERLADLEASFGDHPFAPAVVVALYVVGSLVMLPITALILATALTFEPAQAIAYSLLGSVASGLAGFAIGHGLARDTVRRLAGSRLNRLSRLLARRGIVAVMALRVLPAGPFTIVNIVAGASHIRWLDFTLGTALGLAPGILAVNLFKARVAHAIREPGWDSVLLVGIVLAVIVLGLAWARRTLRHLEHDEE